MEIGSGTDILSKRNKIFFFISSLIVLSLALSSCVLVKDSTKPLISNFTKSATLLSQHMIYFKANIIDTGSGLDKVAFELNNSPLPLSKEGSSVFVASWLGVYGSYNITVLAQDRAGNIATKTDSFFVADSTPPIIEVKTPLKVAKSVEFPLSVKAYDLQSGIKSVSLEIDGESVPISSNETLKWIFSSVGTHYISLTAINNQGLMSTKEVTVNVVNERKVPPYAQFISFPNVLQSDKSATFTVYAYSPNGIKEIDLKVGKVAESLYSSKNNTYTFHLPVYSLTDELVQATCTVYDALGVKKVIATNVLVLSKDSTSVVLFPHNFSTNEFESADKYVKIPFFVGGTDLNALKIKAYVDGVPVDITGSFPEMFALWNPSAGNHVLAIALNGKITEEKEFSFSPLEKTSSSSPATR